MKHCFAGGAAYMLALPGLGCLPGVGPCQSLGMPSSQIQALSPAFAAGVLALIRKVALLQIGLTWEFAKVAASGGIGFSESPYLLRSRRLQLLPFCAELHHST